MCTWPTGREHFNPRSPCGERRRTFTLVSWYAGFQSTLPVWGATILSEIELKKLEISIHAPRVGSDSCPGPACCRCGYFNPRSPCGERQAVKRAQGGSGLISIHAPRVGSDSSPLPGAPELGEFQSTLPVWGATRSPGSQCAANFNPRSPCGERQQNCTNTS